MRVHANLQFKKEIGDVNYTTCLALFFSPALLLLKDLHIMCTTIQLGTIDYPNDCRASPAEYGGGPGARGRGQVQGKPQRARQTLSQIQVFRYIISNCRH